MEKQLKEAVDDLSLIKNVLANTRKSFSSFSRIFIVWGVMYLFVSCFNLLLQINEEFTMSLYNEHAYIIFMLPLLLYGIGAYTFVKITRQQPLIGLERHLMVLWILIITMQLMRVVIETTVGDNLTKIVITTSNLGIMSYALGIALVMTGILTELKNFKLLGGLYILFAFAFSYLPYYSVGRNFAWFGVIIMPFTLIYTGVYLKRHHERSNYGTELDS